MITARWTIPFHFYMIPDASTNKQETICMMPGIYCNFNRKYANESFRNGSHPVGTTTEKYIFNIGFKRTSESKVKVIVPSCEVPCDGQRCQMRCLSNVFQRSRNCQWNGTEHFSSPYMSSLNVDQTQQGLVQQTKRYWNCKLSLCGPKLNIVHAKQFFPVIENCGCVQGYQHLNAKAKDADIFVEIQTKYL